MKKVIYNLPKEQISVSDITTKDILLAKNGEKIVSCIQHCDTGWCSFSIDDGQTSNWGNLFEMIKETRLKNYTIFKVE